MSSLPGTFVDESSYDVLITDDCDVYKPNGDRLLVFRRGILSTQTCQEAYSALRDAAKTSFNRGVSAGKIFQKPGKSANIGDKRKIGKMTGVSTRIIKKDGTLSNTHYAQPVNSGIIGFFERVPRFPYCRKTSFNAEHAKKFKQALPLFQEISQVFSSEAPERFIAQQAVVAKTSPDFIIPGTAFSTVTVNKNWRTAVHADAGDYAPGFGVLTALRGGKYTGAYFVIPKYRVAVDMQTTDLLLCDVHEFHGNTRIAGVPGSFERISLVLYYRRKMIHCGTAAEEYEIAKRRKSGPMFGGET